MKTDITVLREPIKIYVYSNVLYTLFPEVGSGIFYRPLPVHDEKLNLLFENIASNKRQLRTHYSTQRLTCEESQKNRVNVEPLPAS